MNIINIKNAEKTTIKTEKHAVINQFIQMHGTELQYFILSLVKQKELAEDLYQDTLLKVFLAYETYVRKAKLKSWVYTIAINHCRDYWRKQKREQLILAAKGYGEELYCKKELTPEEKILDQGIRQEIHKHISQLPFKYKETIYLYYFKGYTINDIANRMNLPISTVKTRLRRGRERLRSNGHSESLFHLMNK